MSNLKFNHILQTTEENELDHKLTEDQICLERQQARDYVCNEITRYAVEILDFYSNRLGKNQALGLTIECLSESLGNLISLVSDSQQEEIISVSQDVIRQGLVNQQELIAIQAYGQVGHA